MIPSSPDAYGYVVIYALVVRVYIERAVLGSLVAECDERVGLHAQSFAGAVPFGDGRGLLLCIAHGGDAHEEHQQGVKMFLHL